MATDLRQPEREYFPERWHVQIRLNIVTDGPGEIDFQTGVYSGGADVPRLAAPSPLPIDDAPRSRSTIPPYIESPQDAIRPYSAAAAAVAIASPEPVYGARPKRHRRHRHRSDNERSAARADDRGPSLRRSFVAGESSDSSFAVSSSSFSNRSILLTRPPATDPAPASSRAAAHLFERSTTTKTTTMRSLGVHEFFKPLTARNGAVFSTRSASDDDGVIRFNRELVKPPSPLSFDPLYAEAMDGQWQQPERLFSSLKVAPSAGDSARASSIRSSALSTSAAAAERFTATRLDYETRQEHDGSVITARRQQQVVATQTEHVEMHGEEDAAEPRRGALRTGDDDTATKPKQSSSDGEALSTSGAVQPASTTAPGADMQAIVALSSVFQNMLSGLVRDVSQALAERGTAAPVATQETATVSSSTVAPIEDAAGEATSTETTFPVFLSSGAEKDARRRDELSPTRPAAATDILVSIREDRLRMNSVHASSSAAEPGLPSSRSTSRDMPEPPPAKDAKVEELRRSETEFPVYASGSTAGEKQQKGSKEWSVSWKASPGFAPAGVYRASPPALRPEFRGLPPQTRHTTWTEREEQSSRGGVRLFGSSSSLNLPIIGEEGAPPNSGVDEFFELPAVPINGVRDNTPLSHIVTVSSLERRTWTTPTISVRDEESTPAERESHYDCVRRVVSEQESTSHTAEQDVMSVHKKRLMSSAKIFELYSIPPSLATAKRQPNGHRAAASSSSQSSSIDDERSGVYERQPPQAANRELRDDGWHSSSDDYGCTLRGFGDDEAGAGGRLTPIADVSGGERSQSSRESVLSETSTRADVPHPYFSGAAPSSAASHPVRRTDNEDDSSTSLDPALTPDRSYVSIALERSNSVSREAQLVVRNDRDRGETTAAAGDKSRAALLKTSQLQGQASTDWTVTPTRQRTFAQTNL